jgi:hypothetical protein
MYISKTTLLAVCGLMVTFMILTCHYSSIPLQGSSEQVDTLEWVNNAGDLVSSLKASPEYFAQEKKEIIDSLAKVYNTRPKKVIEYVIATTEGESDIKPVGDVDIIVHPPVYLGSDTAEEAPQIKNMKQDFSSPYYNATVQIGDSSYMHLRSFDTVTVLWKKVKEGSIFNRRNLIQLDVSTANPDTKVSGIKAYRITEKPKRWAIGIGAGYGLPLYGNSFQAVPFIGISIQKTIMRF